MNTFPEPQLMRDAEIRACTNMKIQPLDMQISLSLKA